MAATTVISDNIFPSSSGGTYRGYCEQVIYGAGRWWVIWSTGTYGTYGRFLYKSSTDGVTWSAAAVFYDGADYPSIHEYQLQVCASGTEVHMASAARYFNWIKYKKGTLNTDGTITWNPAGLQTVYTHIVDGFALYQIALDSSGYPMIVFAWWTGAAAPFLVHKSTTKDGTWTDSEILYHDHNYVHSGKLVVTSDGTIYLAYGRVTDDVITVAYYVSGTTWTTERTITGNVRGFTAVGNDLVLTVLTSGNLYYSHRASGTWTDSNLLQSSIGNWSGAITSNGLGTQFAAFWALSSSYCIYNYVAGVATNWIDESSDQFVYNASETSDYIGFMSVAVNGSDVGVVYKTETSNPYNLKFALFQFNENGHILELAFNQSIFTESPTWTDVTDDLMKLATKRGRNHELDKIEAGTMDVTLNNSSGNWWRNNTAGDYYPYVKPLTLCRLRYYYNNVEYPLWYGVVESIKPGWIEDQGGKTPVMEMGCVDLFKTLARFQVNHLPDTVGSHPNVRALASDAASAQYEIVLTSVAGLYVGQGLTIGDDNGSSINWIDEIDTDTNTITMTTLISGTYTTAKHGYVKKFPSCVSDLRIKDVLLELGWPAALTDLDEGAVTVTELEVETGGTNALEHILAVAEAENGIFYISPAGVAIFQNGTARLNSPFNTSQATFSDDDTDSVFNDVDLSDDDTLIYNQAYIAGGDYLVSLIDETSSAIQGTRILKRTGSLIANESDAFNQAYVIVGRYAESKLRASSILILPDADPDDLWLKVLDYDISDRISLQINSTHNPALIDQDYHIEGIEHEWSVSEGLWRTRWQLWDVNQYKILTMQHDGYLQKQSSVSYATAQSASSADSAHNDDSVIVVGQTNASVSPDYNVWRGFLQIDTSGISGDIDAAALLLNIENMVISNEWDLTVVPAGSVVNTLTASNFGDLLSQTTDYGHVTISPPYAYSGYVIIDLNASGIAAINKGGTTRFGLRSSKDISATTPGAPGPEMEYVTVNSMSSLKPPKLILRMS